MACLDNGKCVSCVRMVCECECVCSMMHEVTIMDVRGQM
jgi:hypothetical protein